MIPFSYVKKNLPDSLFQFHINSWKRSPSNQIDIVLFNFVMIISTILHVGVVLLSNSSRSASGNGVFRNVIRVLFLTSSRVIMFWARLSYIGGNVELVLNGLGIASSKESPYVASPPGYNPKDGNVFIESEGLPSLESCL